MHRHLLHNSEILDASEAFISPGQVGFMNGWGVFSTLRVCQGVLFAYERHYDRMARDASRMHVPFRISVSELETALLRLVAANNAFDATLRVAVMRNKGGLFEGPHLTRESDVIAFTTDLTEWGAGVKLSYVPNGRHASSPFAGIKMTSWAQNLTWYEEAHEQGFDEVILLNEVGQVSECTSANIFVIQDENVWTPPIESSGCLGGVTRAILLEQIQVRGLTVAERELTPSDLEESQQVFITSTTRDLLPVLEVDHQLLAQDRGILARLQKAFSDYRDAYVAGHGFRQLRKRVKQAGISQREKTGMRLETDA
ncbi:MAG: aminotransferase class IV [Bryobacteraceae bacterium]